MSDETWQIPMPQSALLFDGAWCAAVARICPSLLLYLVKYKLRPEARMAVHWLVLKELAFQVWIREPPRMIITSEGELQSGATPEV